MMELPSAAAVVVYLSFISIAMGLGWLYQAWGRQRKRLNIDAEQFTLCSYCHCGYLAPRYRQLHRCPRCQCLNGELRSPP